MWVLCSSNGDTDVFDPRSPQEAEEAKRILADSGHGLKNPQFIRGFIREHRDNNANRLERDKIIRIAEEDEEEVNNEVSECPTVIEDDRNEVIGGDDLDIEVEFDQDAMIANDEAQDEVNEGQVDVDANVGPVEFRGNPFESLDYHVEVLIKLNQGLIEEDAAKAERNSATINGDDVGLTPKDGERATFPGKSRIFEQYDDLFSGHIGKVIDVIDEDMRLYMAEFDAGGRRCIFEHLDEALLRVGQVVTFRDVEIVDEPMEFCSPDGTQDILIDCIAKDVEVS